jgi:hypothetical protein
MDKDEPGDSTSDEQSSPSTSISDPTTSVEAPTANRKMPKAAELEPLSSPTTSSPLTSSRSSADVPSEILAEPDDQHSDQKRPTSSVVGRIHGHLLPSGWSCKYFPNTDEYSFEYNQDVAPPPPTTTMPGADSAPVNKTPTRDDIVQTSRRPTLHMFECNYGYHFPTSPTSSMISDLAKQVQKTSAPGQNQRATPKMRLIGYGKHKLMVPTDEDEQARRLRDMFPTATQPVIEQMIQIYHGREGLIKAALISLGYKRATEYNVQQASAQSPIMLMMSKPASKKLFDKLVGYFPDKDETLIKNLMYKYKEVEHEIISALVESSQDGVASIDPVTRSHIDKTISRRDRNGAIMKLRYLKFLYPTCAEIELYHLLNCNDLNAQKVMEIVESRGHQRINIEEALQNRKSQAQQMRAQQAAHAAKDKPPTNASQLVEAHVKRPKPNVNDTRKRNILESLRKTFENLDESLGLGALEAADYNEGLARKFIEEMQPADDALYKQRYMLPTRTEPDVVAFPCKSIQKGDTNFMSIVADGNVYIERHIIECENALALLKVDASTFTQEDFPIAKFTHRQNRQPNLRKGPVEQERLAKIHRESIKLGPNIDSRQGSNYKLICSDKNRTNSKSKALGHQNHLSRGHNVALRRGHNSALVQRLHPFFKDQ